VLGSLTFISQLSSLVFVSIQAYHFLSGLDMSNGHGKKHLCFIKWKFLEAKVFFAVNFLNSDCCVDLRVAFHNFASTDSNYSTQPIRLQLTTTMV
jgi:hypothetical protein